MFRASGIGLGPKPIFHEAETERLERGCLGLYKVFEGRSVEMYTNEAAQTRTHTAFFKSS